MHQGLGYKWTLGCICIIKIVIARPFVRLIIYQCWHVSRSRETFNALGNWLSDARTLASANIVVILVGNKRDLEAEREVTFLEASRFAQENGTIFFQCVLVNFLCKPRVCAFVQLQASE